MRARPDDSHPLRLAAGHRLDDRSPGGGVLLTGSGATVQLNEMAVAILVQCDGTRHATNIARSAASSSPAPDRAREDVLEFLAMAQSIGWVEPVPRA